MRPLPDRPPVDAPIARHASACYPDRMVKRRLPSAARRTQIAEAALRIISEKGVHRLTVAEIGREVGLADGSIFRHFESKQDIVAAAVERFDELLFGDFPPEDPDPRQRLRKFVAGRIRLLREHPSILRLAFNDRLAEAGGEALALKVQSSIARSQAFVRQCLLEAQASGGFPATVPVEVLVWAVVGVLRGVGTAYLAGASLIGEEEAWAAVERLLGLAGRGEAAELQQGARDG